MVAREGVVNAALRHNLETNAIRERPRCIATVAVKGQATDEPGMKLGNHPSVRIVLHSFEEPVRSLAKRRRRKGVRHFRQDSAASDEAVGQGFRGLEGGSMKLIGGVQQRDVIKSVGVYFGHGKGFPWA